MGEMKRYRFHYAPGIMTDLTADPDEIQDALNDVDIQWLNMTDPVTGLRHHINLDNVLVIEEVAKTE